MASFAPSRRDPAPRWDDPSMQIDPLAQSFDGAAGAYEEGRPGYPAGAIDRVTAELGLGPQSTVLDLAAGTGKLTRDLEERFERVIAVEPLNGMLAELRRNLPGVEAHAGRAEEIPLEDEAADAVFVAQAFHWFANASALGEIARVLRPGGGLALLWNLAPWEVRDGPWYTALDDLLESSPVDLSAARRHASGDWRGAFTDDGPFEPLSADGFEHSQRLSREAFIATMASRSYIATLSDSDRAAVLGDIEDLMERDDSPFTEGEAEVPLRTFAFWTRRAP